MRLADGVAAGGQGHGFLVIHGHAGEGVAHVACGLERIGRAVDAFGIHVNQAHQHGGKRVLQVALAGVAAACAAALGEPLLFGAPVDVLLGMPDVFAAEAEAEGLEAHRLVGHGAGQDHQVGPADPVAVFLLDRPEQAARLVEVGVVRPGTDRREALVAGAGTAAAIRDAIGARGVPGQADHQAAVVAPVGRPPVLAVGHQCLEVLLERLDIEFLEFFAIVEVSPHRVGLGVVLVQDVEVQRLGPPVHARHGHRSYAAMHHGAPAFVGHQDFLFGEFERTRAAVRSGFRVRGLRPPRMYTIQDHGRGWLWIRIVDCSYAMYSFALWVGGG